jgi:hypothetical protein
VVEVPETRGTLASLSLNLHDVQRALETVLGEIELFGDDVNQWLDDVRLTPTELAIAAAVASAGAAYYLRRQESRPVDPRLEEASSNWLFARLQTVAGER